MSSSADIEPAALLSVRRDRPDPAHFIGAGKVEELKARGGCRGCWPGHLRCCVVAGSAAQSRARARHLGARSHRADSCTSSRSARKAAKASCRSSWRSCNILSTRLVRGWSHLERQRGGLGKTGGPGEKQIEIDRRLIGVRVRRLRERLKQSEKQRRTRRRARSRVTSSRFRWWATPTPASRRCSMR